MRLRIFAVLAAAVLASACATGRPSIASGPYLTLVPDGVLPPPAGVDVGTSDRPYRIGPFDRLSITVFGVPELSVNTQADASGRISLPLVGVVGAAGKTPGELAAEISTAMRGRYVRDPQVSVNLEETVSQVVTVDGEVREPGVYPVLGRTTLMRTVATAKGVTEFARLSDVVVFRTVGDQQMAALYNLEAIRRGNYPDPEIFAHDVVVVGDSPGRRMFRDFLQASPILSAPLVALLSRI